MLYLACKNGLYEVDEESQSWRHLLDVASARRVALHRGRLYCAAREGLWRSSNGGTSWEQIFAATEVSEVTALEVTDGEHIYLGTEMSAVFVTNIDNVTDWQRSGQLESLSSADEWSFPPRPDTHHVRWLKADPTDPQRLYAAIEAGALVRTFDGGRSWQDRVEGSPLDTHHLAIHPRQPNHLWSAAGDGIFCSKDRGDSWAHDEEGLEFTYGWSVAIDSGEPDNIILSVAPGPRQAHDKDSPHSTLYRKPPGSTWREIRSGLPDRNEHQAFVLTQNRQREGVFYAADCGSRLYRSVDGGANWCHLQIEGLPETGRCEGLAQFANGKY